MHCRQAAEKARLEQEALTRLHVMNLPDKITEDKHLSILFESFGKVRLPYLHLVLPPLTLCVSRRSKSVV